MAHNIQIFNVISINEEYEREFYNFFEKYNLLPLFTNEHRTGEIKVTDNDLRAVVNTGGAYHRLLKDFADYLTLANDNKSYEEAIFKIIDEANTFQKLMNNIKKVKQEIEGNIGVGHLFNTWNIVWYNKDII